MTKEKLINTLIKESDIHSDMNHSILEVIIHSDYDISKSKPKLGVKTYFFLPSLNKKVIDPVHKEAQKILARKKDVVDRKELYATIIEALKPKFQ
jgi:hypothetical protein